MKKGDIMDDQQIQTQNQRFGRTVPDLLIQSTYFIVGISLLIAFCVFAYLILGKIPTWFFIAVGMSFIFIPFLNDRARQNSNLYVVLDEPFKLTEYRIGRKYGLKLQGRGVRFQSNSGTNRILLSKINENEKTAQGFEFAEMSQLDQVRDMNTLQNAIQTLEETLREQRISMQTVGVEVEKKSIEIVDWALKTIYGSIIPTEISESFGVEVGSPNIKIEDEIEGEAGYVETIEE
jgi:hypothetical protein